MDYFLNINKNRLIIILTVLFIISRLLFLFYSPYIHNPEEVKTSSLGYDIVFNRGLRVPMWGYLDSPHSGGHLLAQIEIIPFYLIFGNTLLALKMAAIFNSLIVFLLCLNLLKKYFSEVVIIIFSIFFILGTPHFLQKSVMILGNSMVFVLFIMLAMTLITKIFIDNDRHMKNFILLGFVSGLGLWVQYGFISIILLIIILVFMYIRSIEFRNLIILPISFLIGFLPWIIYNISYGFPSIFSDPLIYNLFNPQFVTGTLFSGIAERMISFLVLYLPRSFHFLDFLIIKAPLLSYTFYFIVISLIFLGFSSFKDIKISGTIDNKKKKGKQFFMLVLLYFFICFLVFNIMNPPPGDNPKFNSMDPNDGYYLLFFHPLLFLITSLCIGQLIAGSKLQKISYSLFIACVLIMSVGFFSTLQFGRYNPGVFREIRSYTEANVFEAGFNYVMAPAIFMKFYNEIDKDTVIKEAYLSGMSRRIIKGFDIGGKQMPYTAQIREILNTLNSEDKKKFFLAFLTDELIPSYELVNQLYNILDNEEKKMFNTISGEIVR